MHLTLLTTPIVVGFWLLAAGASCSSRLSHQVIAEGFAIEDAGGSRRRAPSTQDTGLEQDAALDSSGALEPDSSLTVSAASDCDFEPSRASVPEVEDAEQGPTAVEDAQTADTNPAHDSDQSDADSAACLSGREVSVVGCESILRDCPLDTELVVLCFTIWNKSRSQVMQGTLACFENYGCKPGAADALSDCFVGKSQLACVEDRSDCTELADTCESLTKASCEVALAPFHDSIREKTLTCVREETAVQGSESDASCLESFENCLIKVSSPVTL